MREIKFRGLTKDKQAKFVYGCYRRHVSKQDSVVYEYISDDNGTLHPIRKGTVGEYTGLKDKNGKEIYEGDILQSDLTGEIDVVEWETDENVSFVYSGWWCRSYGKFTEERVVVGNIHENPELLNSEEEETGK